MQKRHMLFLSALAIGMLSFAGARTSLAADTGKSGYKVTKTVPVAGDGFWDYVTVDPDARRIYVSHGTHVAVIDADTFAPVGEIADTQGVHGIAIAPEFGRGYTSNGRTNNVSVFDLKTLKTLATVNTGQNPDAIIYDPASKRVFAFNGRSKDATVINAADNTVVGTIPLGGKPEFGAADGKGKVYVNIEDTAEIVELDAKAAKELRRFSIKPCEEPTGLSMDTVNRRLFAGCDNKMVAVVNPDTGKVVATPAAGDGIDATAFDPGTGYVLASAGEGVLTVIKQDGPDKYTVLENVPTKKTARTMGLDTKTHTVVLPSAEMLPPKEGEKRPTMKPGSFALVVVSK